MRTASRAKELNRLLVECKFPSICIHGHLNQEERIARYKSFKDFSKRIMVATDVFGRGIDIERVNIVINYDMPHTQEEYTSNEDGADTYLHRVCTHLPNKSGWKSWSFRNQRFGHYFCLHQG